MEHYLLDDFSMLNEMNLDYYYKKLEYFKKLYYGFKTIH